MIPGIDQNSIALQVGLSIKIVKHMDILQVSVSILIPRKCKPTQGICQLQSFGQHPCAIQNFISDFPSVNNVNNDSDSNDLSISARYSRIKHTKTYKREEFMHMCLYLHKNDKPLNLRCISDTATAVNAIPVSMYKKLSYIYNLSKLGPIQTY